MKKVIIISYFFTPCNLTGANRATGWAKDLINFDIYPIVVTRNWDTKINSLLDLSLKSGKEDFVVKNSKSTIHYLKHNGTAKDRFVQKYGGKYSFLRRILSFKELFFQNLNILFSPYYNLYKYTKKLIQENNDIDTVIISGMPFYQFFIGYKLKKEFPHLNWIADYRDEWTSRPNFEKSKSIGLINFWDKYFEKKWVSTAKCITYVDDYYLDRIKKNINHKNAHTIMNGFHDGNLIERKLDANKISLTFAGTLYLHQDIETLAKTINKFTSEFPSKKIQINFIGSKVNNGAEEKIIKAFNKNISIVHITDRISEQEVITKYLSKTDALLMFPIKNMENVVPTKIINTIPYGIPIIFYPTDFGAIHKLLNKIQLGIATNNQEELITFLNQIKNIVTLKTKSNESIKDYSNEAQVKKLAYLLKSL